MEGRHSLRPQPCGRRPLPSRLCNADPQDAHSERETDPDRILLWHANYHPDGGQLFFPLDRAPFVVPPARAGDDVKPEEFVCFRVDGSRGL
jgi:hypothetical protein